MGTMDKFRSIIGLEEVDEPEEAVEEKPVAPKRPEREVRPVQAKEDYYKERRSEVRRGTAPGTHVRDQHGKEVKLLVIEPNSFDECSALVDNLTAKKPLVINLEKLDTQVAKRIFDFLSGAIYALDGKIQRVANNIFVFAPANVDITSNVDDTVNRPESYYL